MITVSVSGDRTVARGLGTLAGRLSDLSPAFREIGGLMTQAAVPITPVLTGQLVQSLVAKDSREGVAFGSDVVYAAAQNQRFGFLDAAAQVASSQAADEVEDLLTDTARRAGLSPI